MERIVDVLIEVSVYSAAITAGILLFRALFRRRISPRVQYMMWLLLVLRLMLPVTIESGFHIPDLLPEPELPAVQEIEAYEAQGEAAPHAPDAQPAPAMPYEPVSRGEIYGAPAPERAEPEIAPPASVDWRTTAFWVWAAGAALYGLWLLGVKARYYEAMQQSIVGVPRRVYGIYGECCAELGVEPITLWPVDSAISPGIAFFGGPALLLPASMQEEEKLRYAFLHELTHKKRYDHYMTELLALLRVIYWFNPMVHIGFNEMRADMETACDAQVIAHIGRENKRGYLATVLELFSYGSKPQLGMSQAGSKRMAKRRMRGAFMRGKTTLLGRAGALIIAAALLLGCFTTACQSGPAEVRTAQAQAPETDAPEAEAGAQPQSAPEAEAAPEEPQPEAYLHRETWRETFTAGGWLTVNVDAQMEVPMNAPYPVYEFRRADFTPDTLNKVLDTVMGGPVELASYGEGGIDAAETLDSTQIQELGVYLCKAEDGQEWELTGRSQTFMSLTAYPRDDVLVQWESWLWLEGTTLDNVKISYEEAEARAGEVLEGLGITGMGVAACDKARVTADGGTLSEGWELVYASNAGGRAPFSADTRYAYITEGDGGDEYNPLYRERIEFFIDEAGVRIMDWWYPTEITGTADAPLSPLSIERIKDSVRAGFEPVAGKTAEMGGAQDFAFRITDDIVLTNCVVQPEYGSPKGYLIPVWMVACRYDGERYDGASPVAMYISAADGSIINPYFVTDGGERIAELYEGGAGSAPV